MDERAIAENGVLRRGEPVYTPDIMVGTARPRFRRAHIGERSHRHRNLSGLALFDTAPQWLRISRLRSDYLTGANELRFSSTAAPSRSSEV